MRWWTGPELAEHKFSETFLVSPIIPIGGLVFLYGKRNIGKSQAVLTIACCMAEQGALFGRYPVRQRGNIVYVQADMAEVLQQQRIKQIRHLHPLPNLHMVFPRYLEILELKHDSELTLEILERKPIMVVWDTLAKSFHGDTNVDFSSSLVYARVRELFPEPVHLFVHHDKKTIADQDKLDPEELFRGSGAWIDNADTGIHLSNVGGGKLMLQFTKVRSCAQQPPIPLTFDTSTLLLYADASRIPNLADWWRKNHPNGTTQQLEKYLQASFVGNHRAIQHYLSNPPGTPSFT